MFGTSDHRMSVGGATGGEGPEEIDDGEGTEREIGEGGGGKSEGGDGVREVGGLKDGGLREVEVPEVVVVE